MDDPILPELIAQIAEAEVGVREQPLNSNKGERVDQYKAATWLPPLEPWPWCAAFVDWVVWSALKRARIQETETFRRPKTAGAWDLINWALQQDNTIRTRRQPGGDIQRGDLIVFTFSHCGVAVGAPKGGTFATVEGNTDEAGSREGGGVYRRVRRVDQVRARLRFTV